jgi:hypothetical protein
MTQKKQIVNVIVVSVVYPFLHEVCLSPETVSEILDISRVNSTVAFALGYVDARVNVGGLMNL